MDINELIRSSVQDILAETQTPNEPTAQPAAPQPISLNIQGQTYTFQNQAELEAQLNQVAVAQRQQQYQQPVTPPAPQVTGGKVSDDEGSGFSNDEYIRLMNEDPRKATKYALSHVLFDGKIEDPTEILRETMIAQAATQKQLAVYQFKDAYKEIPVEDPRVGGAIEKIRTDLGLPFTAQGLEAAYLYGVGKGQLPNFQAVAANQQNFQQPPQPPQQQYNPYLAAPPTPGRSTTANIPVTESQIEDMSTEQLAKLMYRLQSQGAV